MNEQKAVYCHICGKPLYARDDLRYGDDAWYINELWYCDDCAEDEFRREVTEDDAL